MSNFSAFDIIGPRMIGPSSSHTAGAAKLALMTYRLAKGDVKAATVTLYGSFAETGRGHGTDKALAAGLLGMTSDDKRLRFAILLAEEAGVDIKFIFSDEEKEHPNTAKIEVTGENGKKIVVEGQSIGGGNVLITSIDGMKVRISGEYPTLVLKYADKLGMISKVGDILAEHEINIAFMRVFRSQTRETACMVVETDTPVTDEIAAEIEKSLDKVYEVRTICR